MNTKFRGTQNFINQQTGEIVPMQIVEKSVSGDSGFHKIWLGHILELVDEVGNAKMKVLMWLLANADSQNQILATYDEIAQGAKVGRSSVRRLMSALRGADVITETRRSLWRLNPDVIWQGKHQKRMNVLIKYRDESQPDLFEPVEQEPEYIEKAHNLRRVA